MVIIIGHLEDKIKMDILRGVLLPWSEMKVVKIEVKSGERRGMHSKNGGRR